MFVFLCLSLCASTIGSLGSQQRLTSFLVSIVNSDIASAALSKYNIEKDVAAYIKKEFDKKYNPTW